MIKTDAPFEAQQILQQLQKFDISKNSLMSKNHGINVNEFLEKFF